MDDSGAIHRSANHLIPAGHKSLSDREAMEFERHPPHERHVLLAWMRFIECRPKLKGLYRTIAKQSFIEGWKAHDAYIQED